MSEDIYKYAIFLEKDSGGWSMINTLGKNIEINQDFVDERQSVDATKMAFALEIKDKLIDMKEYGYEDKILVRDLPESFEFEDDYSHFADFKDKSKEEVIKLVNDGIKKRNESLVKNTMQVINEYNPNIEDELDR